MDNTSAPGPDNILAHIYKDYAEELVDQIMKILRLSLETGKMPEGTILAIITSIYKSGDKIKVY